MKTKKGWTGYALAFAAAVLLCALCLLSVSCAGRDSGGTGTSGGGGSDLKIDDQGDVDALLEDVDSIMGSVDPEDFNQNGLSDSELGL